MEHFNSRVARNMFVESKEEEFLNILDMILNVAPKTNELTLHYKISEFTEKSLEGRGFSVSLPISLENFEEIKTKITW